MQSNEHMEVEVFRIRKVPWGWHLGIVVSFAIFSILLLPMAHRNGSNQLWLAGSICLIFTVVLGTSFISELRQAQKFRNDFFESIKVSEVAIEFIKADHSVVFATDLREISDLVMVQSKFQNDMIIVCRDKKEFSFPIDLYRWIERRHMLRKRIESSVGIKFHYVSIRSRNEL